MTEANPSVFTWQMELRITLRSLRLLKKELGLLGLGRLAFHMIFLQIKGEPFAQLPKAQDEGEIFSRRQIGPAIVLYKALRKLHSQDRALAIAEKIVIDSTLVFLRKAVGAINQSRIEGMDEEQKQNWLSKIAGQFLNATIRWNHIKLTELSFTITHCHFPVMCRETGVPELAPIFCKGDAVYFGQDQEGVKLTRPHTIAKGSDDCLFEMELVQIKAKP